MSKSSVRKRGERRLGSKMSLYLANHGKGANPNAYKKPGSTKK